MLQLRVSDFNQAFVGAQVFLIEHDDSQAVFVAAWAAFTPISDEFPIDRLFHVEVTLAVTTPQLVKLVCATEDEFYGGCTVASYDELI